jgi:transposase-like protein
VRKELDAARSNAEAAEWDRDQFRRLAGADDDQLFDGREAVRVLREVSGYTPGGGEYETDTSDPEFLAAVGVPEDWRGEAELWDGWTAGLLREGVRQIAEADGLTGPALVDRATQEAERAATVERRKAAHLEAELAALGEATAEAERSAASRAAVPGRDQLDKVMRYESHLARQLTQTLHLLERLQAVRAGSPPTPPAAVDVMVEAGVLALNPAG